MTIQGIELCGDTGIAAIGTFEAFAQCPAPDCGLRVDIDDMTARTEDFGEICAICITIGAQITENVRGTATIIIVEIHGKTTYRAREAIAPSSS